MKEKTVQLPAQMSTIAPSVDNLYYFIFWVSVAFFVLIMGFMLYFMVKYRRSQNPQSTPPGHHNVLELTWTFAPLLLLFPMFKWGFDGYMEGLVAPAKAIEIRARAKQWSWEFDYGKFRKPGELTVPVNTPVKITISSEDVLHSFFIPEFRVKRDAVPGMYSSVWFEATATGPAQIYCTEYCGKDHALMLAKVNVVSAEEYKVFLEKGDKKPEGMSDEDWGKQLFTANACNTCHSVDGSRLVGPTFKGLFGRDEKIEGGESITVDENYIRESLLRPQAKIVATYGGARMPPFVLKDPQIDALIAYIKTLK